MFQISIIIPCYNVSQYIDRCLTSIVNQTMGVNSLQIICIDDASTDNTWQCLQQWKQLYPNNIILIHLDSNRRQGTARNIAMQYVTAPWISFIDADDWIEPDYCEIMYSYASTLNCDVVCCSYERDSSSTLSFLKERGSESRASRYLVIDTIEKRKIFFTNKSMGYPAWSKLIRTSLLIDNKIYFSENVAYEDDLWGSFIHMYTESVMILELKLYHYFINPSSTVLKENSYHHIDWITAMLIKWKEWKVREVFELYRNELEYDFLTSCYLGFFRTLILRYNDPPYSLYLLLREIVLELIPCYESNPYLKEGLNEFQQLLLPALSNQLSKREFELLARNARIYLGIHG